MQEGRGEAGYREREIAQGAAEDGESQGWMENSAGVIAQGAVCRTENPRFGYRNGTRDRM
jgi:hypothetical protein